MKLARHDLVAALSLRYDHYSAQNVFEAACQRANLGDQEYYDVAQVAAFRAALAKVGDRLARVDERLDSLLGAVQGPQEPAASAKAVEPVKPEPVKPEPVKPESVKVVEPVKAEPAKPVEPATPGVIELVLRDLELAEGEALFVCGDRDELGNWDPERARPMRRAGKDWSTVVPQGEGVFKFLRRNPAGEVTWEGGDNRELGTAVKIETSWQA